MVMDINKISENLDDFNIDELELSEDNLCEIEIEAIRKQIKSKIKKPRRKGKIVAASTAILITGTMFTPAIAKNLPFISDIYKELGFFDGYEEYTKYIGESKSDNGYEITIDNIVGTQNKLMFTIRVKSPVKLSDDDIPTILIGANLNEFAKANASAMSTTGKRIDDFNYAYTIEQVITENLIPEKGNVKILVSKHKPMTLENQMSVEFDLNIDFKSAFDETKIIKVNKNISDESIIREITTTISDTTVISKHIKNDYDEFRDRYSYYLNIDGTIYSNYGGLISDAISRVDFPLVTSEMIKNAKNIEVIEVKSIYNREEIEQKIIKENNEIIDGTFENITYPKEVISSKGLKGEFYKVKKEKNSIKFYFRSEYDPLLVFTYNSLSEDLGNGEYKFYNGELRKNEEGYILEFKNINSNNKLNLNIETSNNIDTSKVMGRAKVK